MFWTWLIFFFVFQKNNFSFFEKMLWGSGAIFLRLLGSHREKISRWKNLFIFQRLMFLYQLVNLVLETCLIFSKTLKLIKTFLSWVAHFSSIISNSERYDSPIPDYFFWNSFQESVTSWVFGVFYKVNCGVDLEFFDTSLSERCFICWLVKELIPFWVSGIM